MPNTKQNILDFKNKTVFLSGPMTGYPEYNKEAFYTMEMKFRESGFASVKNPIHIGEKFGFDQEYNFYLKKSLSMLLEADAVYVFGDYSRSKGVKCEMEVANKVGIPLFLEEYDPL